MPVTIEQLTIFNTDDFQKFTHLHVYGNLLTLYGCRIEASLVEAGRLYEEFVNFQNKLFTIYISYVLANAGYSVKALIEDELYTNEFSENDWVQRFDIFPPCEGSPTEWELDYENVSGERIRIIFSPTLMLKLF